MKMRNVVSPRPSASKYSAIQCSLGSSPSSVLHTKAAGRASIVEGSPSLGMTLRKIDLGARTVIDATQHQTFRQGAKKQILVRMRSSARGNGIHLAVDGSHRILDRALLESFDVRHLHGRIQGGLPCKQGGIDDVDSVISTL